MNRLKRNLPILKEISKISTRQRNKFLRKCHSDVIKTLVDITDNLLRGNFKISEFQRRKLKKHAQKLRKFTCKNESLAAKRKKLSQKGGIFPFLVPLIAALPSLATAAKIATVASGLAGTAACVAATVKNSRQ